MKDHASNLSALTAVVGIAATVASGVPDAPSWLGPMGCGLTLSALVLAVLIELDADERGAA